MIHITDQISKTIDKLKFFEAVTGDYGRPCDRNIEEFLDCLSEVIKLGNCNLIEKDIDDLESIYENNKHSVVERGGRRFYAELSGHRYTREELEDFIRAFEYEEEPMSIESGGMMKQKIIKRTIQFVNGAFYGRLGNTILTPIKAAETLVGLLPQEFMQDKEATLLNICEDNGEILVQAYNRMMEAMEEAIPDAMTRRVIILMNRLHAVAPTESVAAMVRKRLYGSIHLEGNIKVIAEHKINEKSIVEEFGDNMKFDAVIGNPPYQSSSKTIYQDFIDNAIRISSDHVAMIVKNNWMTSDTLKDTRERMIKNGLYKVIDYPVIHEVFDDVAVIVNIFALSKKTKHEFEFRTIKNGVCTGGYTSAECASIILSNKLDATILDKTKADRQSNGEFSINVLPTEPFRINSNFTVGRGIHTYNIEFSEVETAEFNVKLACLNGRKLEYKYIRKADIPNRSEIADTYKILSGGILSDSDMVVTNINEVDKMSVCTASLAMLYCSNDINENHNAMTYIKTRTFRFLVKLLMDGGMTNISSYRFSLVPTQDFSKPWTDQELYEKYDFTQEEINHIESTIKAYE